MNREDKRITISDPYLQFCTVSNVFPEISKYPKSSKGRKTSKSRSTSKGKFLTFSEHMMTDFKITYVFR
jgi:hypothetical protein